MTDSFIENPILDHRLRIYILKRNFQMLYMNYIDLKELLIISHDKEKFQKLWEGDVEQIDNIIFEFSRLLINYISMAKAVVDVNRILVREWFSDTDFLKKYQDEVEKRFANNPLVAFVHDIRNYALHYRLPIANLKFPTIPNAGDESNQFEFVLSSPKLNKWDGWSPSSKSFLLSRNNSIKIEEFIDEYYILVSEFYKWVFSNFCNNDTAND
jgi:hypothetical protein